MTDSWAVGPYLLRPHQIAAVEQTRAAMAACMKAGKKPRVILQGVCGFGKTVAEAVSKYIEENRAMLTGSDLSDAKAANG